ncbi:MAG TPA: RdgB/HAM1 family non-canonical purine NTP pyrophosphatase [Terriglobales bacterium]
MLKRVYVASSNPGKLRDFATAAAIHAIEVLPIPTLSAIPAPAETGDSFEANARLKAEYYSHHARGELVLADDSGLTVDALDGEPGVRSARYAEGHEFSSSHAQDEANNRLVLHRMNDVPDARRGAAFVCVIAVARDGVTLAAFPGEVRGQLLHEPRGHNGFGYDPLFFFPEMKRSFAELSNEEKLSVSHRGRAFEKFLMWFNEAMSAAI